MTDNTIWDFHKVCEYLGLTSLRSEHAKRYIREGVIPPPSFTIPISRRRWTRDDVVGWVERKRAESEPE